MSDGKREIIARLIEEYDIRSKVNQTANCLIMTLVTISLFLLGLNDPVWVLRGNRLCAHLALRIGAGSDIQGSRRFPLGDDPHSCHR